MQVVTVVDNICAAACVLKTIFKYYLLIWKQYSTKDFLNLSGYFGIKTIYIFITLKMDSSFRFINLGLWVKKKPNTKK